MTAPASSPRATTPPPLTFLVSSIRSEQADLLRNVKAHGDGESETLVRETGERVERLLKQVERHGE